MKEKLMKLLENSYSPYSNFRVACIAVMKDGKEFVGVNVENAAYGPSVCAERSAILSAISNGYKKYDFDKLYVMCDSDKVGMPCFACRQVFVELIERDRVVICMSPNGDEEAHTIAELCPYPFSDEDLK